MAAMVDLKRLPGRSVVMVKGADAGAFLKGLVTNGPVQEAGCFSALLTPQGKILFDFYISKAPDGYYIDVHEDATEALVKRLMLYRLRAKVEIGIDEERIICFDRNLAEAGPDTSTNLPADITKNRVAAPANETGEVAIDADYHARRIAAGVPEWGADFGSDEVFLTDVNYDALGGVSYKKGCFIGQEVSSRMKRKGQARRRTLIAAFDGAAPEKGASITAGGSTLGDVLSSAGDRALALIRMDRWEKTRAEGAAPECEGRALRLIVPDYLKQD